MTRASLVVTALGVEALALRLGARDLRIVRSGMGPVRARATAATLARDPVSAMVVAGLGGALVDDRRPGELFVADRLIGPDGRERSLEGASLRRVLAHQGLEARGGVLVSSETIVSGAARERLAATGASVVDMESAWLAEGAAGRPLAVLRVVVDGPDRELWRPATLRNGWRALRALGRAASALRLWAASAHDVVAPDDASTIPTGRELSRAES